MIRLLKIGSLGAGLAIILGAGFLTAASGAELVGGVDTTLGAPFMVGTQARAEGLLIELYALIAAELRKNLKLVFLHRKRLPNALKDGQVDILCNVSKAWVTDGDPEVLWSGSLYKARDVLIRRSKNTLPDNDPMKITGMIATALGYAYPTLDRAFEAGRLKRIDVPTDRQIVDMVVDGRVDFGVLSIFIWSDRLRTNPEIAKHVKVIADLDPVDVECQYRRTNELAQHLTAAFAKLRTTGAIDTLTSRYGAAH
jgi:polar amino acid transport system substrate-binding protein